MKMTRVKVIPEHESLTVEFKSDLKKLADSEIVDTVVALSNTDGGSLFQSISWNRRRRDSNWGTRTALGFNPARSLPR